MSEVTFPQLIQRACGIDVHLKVVVATIDGVGLQREPPAACPELFHQQVL